MRIFAGLLGAALLLMNVGVASAAKREFRQEGGSNASVGVNGQLDDCRTWYLSSTLSESSTKTEPGAKVVINRAILYFSIDDACNNTVTSFDLDLPDVARLTGNLTGASLNVNRPVALTSCGIVDESWECTTSTAQVVVNLSWSSNGSPVRFRQHITNLAPDGVRSSIRIEGNSRDSTTTGSVMLAGQTYSLTADNVFTSALTSDAKMFVVLTRN